MPDVAGKMTKLLALYVMSFVLCVFASASAIASPDVRDGGVAIVIEDFPPLYVSEAGGGNTGFAMEVLDEVAKRANIRYELLVVKNWGEALDALESGQGDFIPGIGISAARQERFVFSDVFETLSVACFVRSDALHIAGVEDLVNRRAAVLDSSAAQNVIGADNSMRLIPYKTIDEALFSLLAGKVDAFFFPERVLKRKAWEIGVEDQIKVVGKPLVEVKWGYLFRKTDTQLRDRVDEALRGFVGSPQFNESYARWWAKPEPFLTTARVIVLAALLLIVVGVFFAVWRWRTVSGLNRDLKRTMRELLQTQSRLETSERVLNKAQELTTVGGFERNLITGKGYWSEIIYKSLGLSPTDESPQIEVVIDRIHPEDRDKCIQAFVGATPDKPNDCLEFRFKPSGSEEYRYAICLLTYEFAPDGTPLKRIGAIQDITDRKIIEEQLREAKERAEEASRSKSEFLANMSHELRTPLNGAMGMLQLMDSDRLDPEHREYAQIALSSCKNLTTLINDILDLSKVEANKMALSMIDFSLVELLESIHQTFVVLADAKDISFDFDIADDIPECVVGDPARVRQVLFNLVGNAIKFTETGSVTVQASVLNNDGSGTCRMLFSVSDTGVGVPDNMVDGIFGAFTQVDGAYTRRFQGTGLGLHIVKRLVALMGGHVGIESVENSGTTVYVTLSFMVVGRPRPMCLKTTAGVSAAIEPRHILAVEDERVNMLTISRFVERLGHRCSCAENGLEAMRFLKDNDVDLILMDIQMPVMNGIEATRAIRGSDALGDKKNVPIVALTAHSMVGDREAFLGEGMNGYLAKPISMSELEMMLEVMFNG